MSGLFGWVGGTAGGPDARAALQRMGDAQRTREDECLALLCGPAGALGGARLGGEPDLAEADGSLAGLHGVYRWKDPGLAERAARAGGARTLLDAYRERGPAALEALGGSFFAVVIPREGDALLATDRTGTCPVVFTRRKERVFFASSGCALQAHPEARAELDPQGLFFYLHFTMVPAPATVRTGHERLLPGELLRVRDGRAERAAYWCLRFEERPRTLAELEDEFRTLVRESVRRNAKGASTGSFLSGGTDSSTLTGMLGAVTGAGPRAYSIGFAVEGYDEMEYARCAARHFGAEHRIHYVEPADVVAAIPELAAAYDAPFGNESAIAALCCARLARSDGIGRLLGGDGGDELFGGNSRYARQRVFAYWSELPALVRRLFGPLVLHFPFGEKIWPVRKARSYIRQAGVPLPDRLETYNHVERLGAGRIFEPEFLARVDPERAREMRREAYRGVEASGWLNRILGMEMRFTLADNDLVKVNRACELAGVEVAYPFLDEELVEFAAHLPASLKVNGLKLRWFFKHALRDFLPREILHKKKQGFGLPFGRWMASDRELAALAGDSLTDLKRRGIVRPDFLDELLRLHRSEHAVYFGVFVWLLVMLEQWLRIHEDRVARPVGHAGE